MHLNLSELTLALSWLNSNQWDIETWPLHSSMPPSSFFVIIHITSLSLAPCVSLSIYIHTHIYIYEINPTIHCYNYLYFCDMIIIHAIFLLHTHTHTHTPTHTGLAKKFVPIFPYHLTEKPKQTFWPTQHTLSLSVIYIIYPTIHFYS